MQDILIEVMPLIIYAILVGTVSSMIGIGGGTLNIPLLIIVFGFSAQESSSTSLVATLFAATASTYVYNRQNPRPIINRVGLMMAAATIPGSLVGISLREFIAGVPAGDLALRLIFGILLFPVALMMLFAKKKPKGDLASQLEAFDIADVPIKRIAMALIGGLLGGMAAGLLGIGGGSIIVPVLCIIVGLPMHAAVATSMFTMIFTASAGTFRNFIGGHIMPEYALALGVGMLVGAQMGSRLACRVNAVQLKRVFGLVLVFPLVKMMRLGQLWLDPLGTNYLLALTGDILIWLGIVVPIGLYRFYMIKRNNQLQVEPACEPDINSD